MSEKTLLNRGNSYLEYFQKIDKYLVLDKTMYQKLWDIHPENFGIINIFGKDINTPRWFQNYGHSYNFSNKNHESIPIPEILQPYIDFVNSRESDFNYNGILVNWYQDGNQAAGYVLKSDANGEASWGVLSVAGGGTGQTSYTDGQLLIGNTTGNTLTKATLTASTGISITNGTGSITIANSAPDQTVALTGGTGISTSGTYPNFTITNSAPDQTVALTAGTGISTSGTYPNFTITNDSPNQATPAAGGSGQLQYNNGSNGFAASANLAFDAINDILTVQDNIVIKGDGTNDASKLKFNCYNNNHHVEIIGPDHAGSPASYSIKLPNALPNVANQILESNASGTLSWIATPTDTDTSIYAANGSLTGARAVTMGSYNLSFVSSTAGQEVKFGQNVRIDGQSYNVLETISSVTSWTPNWDSGNVQTMELSGATTINNPSNIEVGATYIIILKQDAEGTHTVSWGSQYKFPAGTAPTITTTANKADVITLVAYSSTVLMCTSVQDFATS